MSPAPAESVIAPPAEDVAVQGEVAEVGEAEVGPGGTGGQAGDVVARTVEADQAAGEAKAECAGTTEPLLW